MPAIVDLSLRGETKRINASAVERWIRRFARNDVDETNASINQSCARRLFQRGGERAIFLA